MRRIPATMATQHPDNASIPYWHPEAYISSSSEVKECYLCFSELGIEEYKWDWEGKFVDEAVVNRLLHNYPNYFHSYQLGKDCFLTFRIPNPRVEKQYRLARAFMVILTSSNLAESLGLHAPPVFEVILPLTETAEELIDLQDAFIELSGLKHKLLAFNGSLDELEVIPLFETVEKMMDSVKILQEYIKLFKKRFGKTPSYLRSYCARSDPALNSGLIPTVIAIKIAFSLYASFEERSGIRLFPIIGTGSLPFRGGLTPQTVSNFIKEYKGVKTAVIQSAFRYDYSAEEVKRAIKRLNKELPVGKVRHYNQDKIAQVKKLLPIFTRFYRDTIEQIAN